MKAEWMHKIFAVNNRDTKSSVKEAKELLKDAANCIIGDGTAE